MPEICFFEHKCNEILQKVLTPLYLKRVFYGKIRCMESFDLKRFAHIGDAVYELFVRENVVFKVKSQNLMHKITTSFVCAPFQAKMAEIIYENFLNDDEREIFRRARNLNLTISKKNNPSIHRHATAFEVVIGFLYLNNRPRLEELFEVIKENIETK